MAVEGDLIRIIDVQTYLEQTMLNVYFYVVSALTGVPDIVQTLQNFDNNVVVAIADLQAFATVHTIITWENITDGLEIGEISSGRGGTHAGETAASFVTYNFKLRRTTALTRHGRKSIGGLADSASDGNSPTPVILERDAALLALASNVNIEDAAMAIIGTLNPVIPRRIPATGAPDPLNLNPVASAELRGMGTQNTRKARTVV